MTRSQSLLVAVLGCGQMLAFASTFYLLGVLGAPVAVDLGLRPALVASLLSVALLTSALAAPLVGRWTDARGARPVLLASSLVFAAGLALIAAAGNLAGLVAGMAVLGIGMALGLYETPFALLAALYGQGARRPMAGVALLGGLGSTVGWPATLALETQFGWRGACLVWAAIHLFVALPVAAWLLPRPAAAPHAATPADRRIPWTRPMIQLAVLFAGAWLVSTCIGAHLPALLRRFGLSPVEAVGAASLIGVAAVTMRFLEFTVLRRLPPTLNARVATLLHPLAGAGLVIVGPAAAPLFALAQGGANGMLMVARGVLPLALFGPTNYAYRSALLTTPARFVQIAGPALYGVLLDRSAVLAVLASSAICLVMCACTFRLGPEHVEAPN